MSVPKSQRSVAVPQFLKDITEVRKTTIHMTDKFPKSYYRKTANLLMDLAREAYEYANKGNSVYLSQKTSESIFDLRRKCFVKAYIALETLSREINFCLELVNEGTNFMGSKSEYLPKFHRWAEQVFIALSRLKKVRESDTKRWNQWHP